MSCQLTGECPWAREVRSTGARNWPAEPLQRFCRGVRAASYIAPCSLLLRDTRTESSLQHVRPSCALGKGLQVEGHSRRWAGTEQGLLQVVIQDLGRTVRGRLLVLQVLAWRHPSWLEAVEDGVLQARVALVLPQLHGFLGHLDGLLQLLLLALRQGGVVCCQPAVTCPQRSHQGV